MKHTIVAAACTAALALVAGTSAFAGSWTNASTANASGRCQGALPSFEGALRKRPLALQNEGAAPAFVTCSFLSDQMNDSVVSFGLYGRSVSGGEVTLTCTGVLGYDTGTPVYSTKEVILDADGSQSSIYWDGADFGGDINPGVPVSLNCSLPSGAALNDMYFNYIGPGMTPT